MAEPVEMDAAGEPLTVVWARRDAANPSRATHINVQLGTVIFQVYDQRALEDCTHVFTAAAQRAAEHLPVAGRGRASAGQRESVADGQGSAPVADRDVHPARRAAVAVSPPGTGARTGVGASGRSVPVPVSRSERGPQLRTDGGRIR